MGLCEETCDFKDGGGRVALEQWDEPCKSPEVGEWWHWGSVRKPTCGMVSPGAENYRAWGLPASSSLGSQWGWPPAEVGVLLFHPTDAKTEVPEVETHSVSHVPILGSHG